MSIFDKTLRLESLSAVDPEHGSPHAHATDQLIAVLEGSLEIKVWDNNGHSQGDTVTDLRAGDWIVVPSGRMHSGRTTTANSKALFMEKQNG